MIALGLIALLALPLEVPPLRDEEPPEGAMQGPSSGRLADDVVITFSEAAIDEDTQVLAPGGERVRGETDKPRHVLGRYGLGVARRHFSDAAWSKDLVPGEKLSEKAKKAPKKGRVLLIRSITLEAAEGPVYTARVVVDRIENGKRLGQATGTGVATPDRTRQRTGAAFAPGILGAVAARKASAPSPDKDEIAIRTATLRALDSALLQLAAYWAGEQAAEEARRQAAKAR